MKCKPPVLMNVEPGTKISRRVRGINLIYEDLLQHSLQTFSQDFRKNLGRRVECGKQEVSNSLGEQ